MKRFFITLFLLICLGLAIVAAGGFYIAHEIKKPGAFDTSKTVLIAPGTSGMVIADKLASNQIISQPKIFYLMMRMHPAKIMAGEYEIPAHSNLQQTYDVLSSGKVVRRQFTLAEGLTVKQAMILLQQNEFLTGEITVTSEEGTLLPETYTFTRGDTRDSIVKRMQDSQHKLLNTLWEQRDSDLPLTSQKEAITLASIVEKETGKPSERARIAGLFYNRLKISMPLQSDPTVVYVITDHLGHMGGKRLLGSALQIDSPYNTYKNAGLPPGPIANPGKASLEAVLHPEKNDYLFFVADGTGGHVFSKDLAEHNKNVTEWRKIRAQQ